VAIGASLAFLGMVGTDRQADVVAHVAGLGAGFLLGFAALRSERLRAPWIQRLAAMLALALVAASWGLGFLSKA